MQVERLTHAHCHALRVQPWQAIHAVQLTDDGFTEGLMRVGPAWAGIAGGRVVALGGVIDKGGGRAEAWSFLGKDLGFAMTGFVRATRDCFDGCTFRRIELITHCEFKAAHRLAAMLGFQPEARLRSWFPEDPLLKLPVRDAYLWAKVK